MIDDRPRAEHRAKRAAPVGVAVVLLLSLLAGCAYKSADPAVTLEEDPTLPNHSVYRPTDLDAIDAKLPIIVFGATGCTAPGGTFTEVLSATAAKGYLVVADLPINSLGFDTSAILLAGLDWAVAENARPGSKYFGKLDTGKVAAVGHSCGGLEALHIGDDPRITTVVALDSGIFDGAGPGEASKADLEELHGPTLWMNGGPTDIAYPQAVKDYAQVPDRVPAAFANYDLSDRGDAAHVGTWFDPAGGEMGRAFLLWLDFTLKGDLGAKAQFLGSTGLVTDPLWTVQSKHI